MKCMPHHHCDCFSDTRQRLFHIQYRYEEHKGDDAAVANTDEPNVLAVRLLWQRDHFFQHISTVWCDALLFWLPAQQIGATLAYVSGIDAEKNHHHHHHHHHGWFSSASIPLTDALKAHTAETYLSRTPSRLETDRMSASLRLACYL